MSVWVERNQEHPNYARMHYVWAQHHRRFVAYVEAHGLPCQDCKGMGGYTEAVTDEGQGPWEVCGWCEGEGRVTRWLRGLWLRTMREERQRQQLHAVAMRRPA